MTENKEDNDFSLLRQLARHDFVHLLETMEGVKDLVVEWSLMRPLDRIANMSLLQQHNCAKVQQFGQSLVWGEQSERRVYLVRPTLTNAKQIADHVRADPDRKYSIVFVYRRLYICELELERQSVFGLVDVHQFDMPLLTLDNDLLTMEMPEYSVFDSTSTWSYPIARALWQLQSVYGLIPTVYGLGENAHSIHSLLQRLYGELGEPRSSASQPISHLILLDRAIDLVPVLMTAVTYESLLNDNFGISCGKVSFGEQVENRLKKTTSTTDNEGQTKRGQLNKVYPLNGQDQLYASVRNRHMTAVFPFLSEKAKVLQESYDKGVSLNQVTEMKKFVSSELRVLKEQHKSLELHICACEVVLENSKGAGERLALEHSALVDNSRLKETMSFLEDLMCQQKNQWQTLTMAILYSICQNGIPSREYESFKTQFVQAYGCQFLPALHTLMKLGLLTEHSSSTAMSMVPNIRSLNNSTSTTKPTFQYLAKRLNLIGDVNESTTMNNWRKPDKMNYVYSGAYTPLLCQIVSDALLNGWNTIELRRTFGNQENVVFSKENSYTPANRPADARIRKMILVFFLGGVTFAEIAALRLLAEKNQFRIVIATTAVINREMFIKQLVNC